MALLVPGFRFSALSSGIRKDGRIDTALAVSTEPASAAGLFTRNLVRAAPVLIATERLRSGSARAVLVNAGCANACTGEPGLAAARESTRAVARALAVDEESVLPASTGVIGVVLPSERIVARADELVEKLSAEGADDFATAIMTTDRWKKTAVATIDSGSKKVTVLGIGKGGGMIHPDVGPPHATMLVFLFTDARAEPKALERALVVACDDTLNACSVDGDTSTNDTVLALASGASGVSLDAEALAPAFREVCDTIARSMVSDGEGSSHLVELKVSGLRTREEARRVASTIATSFLVKTALFGKDSNWGRLLAAAGRAGVPFDPDQAKIRVGRVEIVDKGLSLGKQAEMHANAVMQDASYSIELVLGSGPGSARYYMSDLGHGYVDVNAGYRS